MWLPELPEKARYKMQDPEGIRGTNLNIFLDALPGRITSLGPQCVKGGGDFEVVV